jgi:hypothetical protein
MPTSAQARERLALRWQRLTVDLDGAGVDRLQPVDRAAERGLPRTRGRALPSPPDPRDLEADVCRDAEVAEVLLDVRHPDQGAPEEGTSSEARGRIGQSRPDYWLPIVSPVTISSGRRGAHPARGGRRRAGAPARRCTATASRPRGWPGRGAVDHLGGVDVVLLDSGSPTSRPCRAILAVRKAGDRCRRAACRRPDPGPPFRCRRPPRQAADIGELGQGARGLPPPPPRPVGDGRIVVVDDVAVDRAPRWRAGRHPSPASSGARAPAARCTQPDRREGYPGGRTDVDARRPVHQARPPSWCDRPAASATGSTARSPTFPVRAGAGDRAGARRAVGRGLGAAGSCRSQAGSRAFAAH